jgi:hypothetical protein
MKQSSLLTQFIIGNDLIHSQHKSKARKMNVDFNKLIGKTIRYTRYHTTEEHVCNKIVLHFEDETLTFTKDQNNLLHCSMEKMNDARIDPFIEKLVQMYQGEYQIPLMYPKLVSHQVEVLNEDGDVEKVTVKFSDDNLIGKKVKSLELEELETENYDHCASVIFTFADGSRSEIYMGKYSFQDESICLYLTHFSTYHEDV